MDTLYKNKRFPRQALRRRLSEMMQLARDWEREFAAKEAAADTPAVALLVGGRRETCHSLFHDLYAAVSNLDCYR